MKIFIKGLNSCAMRKQKLRQYRKFLTTNGHVISLNPEDSDVVILWTCAFRGDVRDNSISEITRYQSAYRAELIVAGCLPDIAPGLLKENFDGTIINWRDDQAIMEQLFGKERRFSKIGSTFIEQKLCDDVETFRKENPSQDATFHDQFIKLVISEGCRYDCSYCSEKMAFPPYHSFPEDELVEGCRRIAEKTECKRAILLADSLGDYGSDTGTDLPNLIRRLNRIQPELRIALNNLNPAGFIRFFDEMICLLKAGIICHLNLPIQSASERILKLMNRPYNSRDIDRIFALLNEIGFREFDTHVIVGFPTETDDDFDDTLRFVIKHRPKYVLASAFMTSPGMAAYSLPQLPEELKRKRLGEFYKHVTSAGIICNTDDSELAADRCRRLNLSSYAMET